MDPNFFYFVLGTIVTILIELVVMPRLRDWQSGRTHISRQKRQKELRDDLMFIGDLHKDITKLFTVVFQHISIIVVCYVFSLLMLITSMVFLVLDNRSSVLHFLGDKFAYSLIYIYVGDVLAVIGYLSFFIGINLSFKLSGILRNIRQFEVFKQQTESRIQELTGEK